jgi:L-ascorbate metabolism protein UlaG (beta-lactamase superfamily)
MTITLLIILALAGLYTFYRLWVPFGGVLTGARKQAVRASHHNSKGKFVNLVTTTLHMNAAAVISMAVDHVRLNAGLRPGHPIVPDAPDLGSIASATDTQLVWLGHSSFILRIGGKTVLLDPVLSRRASPFQFAGPKRYAGSAVITPDALPHVDAVIISHDHYDHLDYDTIHKLRTKVGRFFVPLGVGAHLERWGVHPDAITELDWWDTAALGGIELVCTPARHFSGRRIGGHDTTLWGSWVIMAGRERVFFSGDTGYGPHFAEIGTQYGPFDLTLMECGQYDRRWDNIHMLPEQTVAASHDLRSKLLLPIHWGAFTLAFHEWTDSVERALRAAHKIDLPVATPRMGQIMLLRGAARSTGPWWKSVAPR